MPQENTIAVILFHFCTTCEEQNEDKISSDNKFMKFTQQLHQCQQLTQLHAQLLVATAVHHVQQPILQH